MRRYSSYAECILCALGLVMALSSCRPCGCCDAVRSQLDTDVKVCPEVGATVNITDCGECGEATAYEIDAHLMALDCEAWQTQPPVIPCVWRLHEPSWLTSGHKHGGSGSGSRGVKLTQAGSVAFT